MQARTKKAAYYAALIYLSCAGLGFGMLKAAQQTRRILYGGQPVMAQCIPAGTAEDPDSYTLSLGGGEWEVDLTVPQISEKAAALADALPPCTVKSLLLLLCETEALADQTAARFMTEYSE